MPVEEMPIEDREPSCPGNTYNYTKRTVFGTLGCGLFGWPSTGGVLIKDGVDAVELDFLRLDRFKESVRSPNAIEEDLFCQELRKIGAKWWRHEADENEVQFDYWSATSKQKQELVFGWPREGGVWVLVFADGRKLPEGFGRIHMAFTMEERCQVIKEYGGTFFANPEDCKHLKDPPEASYDEVDRPPERSCRLD
ncbi:hypothetical protein MMC24_003161 [Lignoscripta atroalba]|nr:hypothetical protein [Lignoscripta atroalba]